MNNSHYYTTISGNDVFVGFIHVEKLEQAWIERVLAEGAASGLIPAWKTLRNEQIRIPGNWRR